MMATRKPGVSRTTVDRLRPYLPALPYLPDCGAAKLHSHHHKPDHPDGAQGAPDTREGTLRRPRLPLSGDSASLDTLSCRRRLVGSRPTRGSVCEIPLGGVTTVRR